MKIESVLIAIGTFLFGYIIYASDWQREQDNKISELDKLIDMQTTLLRVQVDYNEQVERRGLYFYRNPNQSDLPNLPSKPVVMDNE